MQKNHRMSMLASAGLLVLAWNGTAQAQQPGQAPNMSFFVTSAPIGRGGDLGGLEGADRHCQQLATTVGAGNKTWHAYLSTGGANAVNARDRIGNGPWQNSKGTVVATSVDDLHSANNKLSRENSLTERGTMVSGFGYAPNWHDALTGSQPDGRAWPANINLTCGNWTSSQFGSAMLGHIDRTPTQTEFQKSWNSAHMSRGCSQPDLIATGGNGLLYCFAQ